MDNDTPPTPTGTNPSSPPPQSTTQPTQRPGATPTDREQNQWALWVHLSTLSQWLGVPLGGIIGPLVLWLMKKDVMPAVDFHGKQALNFQISMLIYAIVLGIIFVIGFFLTLGFGVIVIIPAAIAFVVFQVWVTILAAIAASEGRHYRYPITIEFIR